MKLHLPLVVLLGLQGAVSAVEEQLVALGDSLTYAYEAEFGFQEDIITLSGPETIGDGFGPEVRNWIEILGDPIYRGDRFAIGDRIELTVSLPFNTPFNLFFRHDQNWAIPGLKVDELRQLLAGEASFQDLLSDGPNFSVLGDALDFSDYDENLHFSHSELESQIQNTATRMTVFVGGNDIRPIYGTIYNGGSAGTFVADFMADMVAVLDQIEALNSDLELVVVNVPHVGITPLVRSGFPYDAVKTERVSAVLRDLNGQLAALCANRGLGYADIYTPTLRMIDASNDLCIHGLSYENTGTAVDDLGKVWLAGPMSANFHPNTNAHTLIANEIIHAFNRRYGSAIAPLTATEMLVDLLDENPADADMDFATWMTCYGLSGLPASDDSDGDGLAAGSEFGLGLNPSIHDSDHVTVGKAGGDFVLSYPVRMPGSSNYSLTPESASSPGGPYVAFGTPPAVEADGLHHARIPIGTGPEFLRLKTTLLP